MKRFAGLIAIVACLGTAFGNEPIINLDLPEQHSPCTFDLDARMIHRGSTKIYDVQSFNCDGANIKSIRAYNSRSFEFTVALRRGDDQDGTVEFRLIDDAGTVVAIGEAYDNLDEGKHSALRGSYQITQQELARVFAEGRHPILRITLRVD